MGSTFSGHGKGVCDLSDLNNYKLYLIGLYCYHHLHPWSGETKWKFALIFMTENCQTIINLFGFALIVTVCAISRSANQLDCDT